MFPTTATLAASVLCCKTSLRTGDILVDECKEKNVIPQTIHLYQYILVHLSAHKPKPVLDGPECD